MRPTNLLKYVSAFIVFTILFTIPGVYAAEILFDARMDHRTENQAFSVDAADLNGDGILDLALVTTGSATILLGRGNGTFEDEVRYWVARQPQSVTIGDLDLDGDPDLVVVYEGTSASAFEGGVAVLLGNGDGTFQNEVKYPAGIRSRVAAIGDFDENGTPDLAMTHGGNFPDPGGIALFSGTGDGTFGAALLITAGDGPFDIAIGDLDGDGHQDLAATNLESNDVSVLRGNGNGTFQSAVHFAVGEGPASVAIHDLDADGAPDLATANAWTDDVSVLLGNGDGTFQPDQLYTAGYNPQAVSVKDFNSDGTPDLAVTNHGNSVSILLGHGNGTFQAPAGFWMGCKPRSGVTADLNGDGAPDLVTANFGDFPANVGSVSVLLGLGDATFRVAPAYETGVRPQGMTTEDLNTDGAVDLVVVFHGDSSPEESGVSVLLGNGNGSFADRMDVAIGIGAYAVAAADLDLDGNPDLALASQYSEDVSVLLGNGDGTFHTAVSYPTGDNANSVAIGDLDGDGNPDLAVTNSGDDNVSVLLGNGDGTFQTAVNHQAGDGPIHIAIADLNRDEILDLAVVNVDDHVSVLLGNGDATYQDLVNYGTGYGPVAIAIGDLNGDGNPDMAVAVQYDSNVSVRLGAGDGTFGPATLHDVDDSPMSIAIGSINNDDSPDLVTATFTGNNISVLAGNGDGTFAPVLNYGAGANPRAAAIADIDGDNDLDLAVVNYSSDEASMLFNIARSDRLVVAGPGPAPDNQPLVRGFPPRQSAAHIYEFPAYGPDRYGVNVSCGDVTGSGTDDLLTGAGPGEIYGPHVRGFQLDGTPLPGLSFLAYGTNKYGVNVTAGDIDGDGYDEIITGAGPGAVFGPHVRGWDYDGTPGADPFPGVSYFAYGTPKWGVNVSAGDIDGDGYDEIVTGAGPGAVYGPHVRGWNVDGGPATAIPGVSFLAYGTNKYGVNVTCGDLDGDGMAEMVTGAGPGAVFGAHVRGWNYDGATLSAISGINFFAWDPAEARYGATVFAGADLNDDGRDELVVGGGPDPDTGTPVKVYYYDGAQMTEWFSLEAFAGLTHGTNVAAGRF